MVFDGISTSQFISLILVPLSVGMLLYLSRRGEVSEHRDKGRARVTASSSRVP
jgi:hypothetical protein